VKVLDVGLVKDRTRDAEVDAGLTRHGHLVGSPDYAAPEQVADSRAVDHRADQYALGCTLYFLLSGELPYPGGTPVQKALRRLTDDPRPIGELRTGLPEGLCSIVHRLLARSPGDRFPDCAAAAAALLSFAVLAPLPVQLTGGDTSHNLPTCPDLRLDE